MSAVNAVKCLVLKALFITALAAKAEALAPKEKPGCGVVSGACENGSLLQTHSAASLAECQQACLDNPDCSFYTFDAANNDCSEFMDCYDLNPDLCPDSCLSGSLECTCMEAGECTGDTIGASNLGLNACIAECYSNVDCNWWNHYSSDDFCLQLRSCTAVDETCTDCVHGERLCYEQGLKDVEVLFVTSGYNEYNEYEDSVEVIPLDSPQLACPGVPAIPNAGNYGNGFVHEGQPVVCAMYMSRQCHKFNTATWQWEEYVQTVEARDRAAGAFLGEDYILLGGSNRPITTETFSAQTETWSSGPEIPYEVWTACATTFHDDQVILTGGFNDDNVYLSNAAVLHVSNGTWSHLPELTAERGFHVCGIATATADGTSALVIAGGHNYAAGFLSDTEIFDLTSGASSWRKGVDIPSGPIEGAHSVPYKQGFLVIGGTPGSTVPLASIWQYDPDNSSMPWILRPEELAVARRYGPVAILMKATDLNCTLPVELE